MIYIVVLIVKYLNFNKHCIMKNKLNENLITNLSDKLIDKSIVISPFLNKKILYELLLFEIDLQDSRLIMCVDRCLFF
jgi:hypothetical protein